jgi:hypothetical protein
MARAPPVDQDAEGDDDELLQTGQVGVGEHRLGEDAEGKSVGARHG